MTFFRVRWHSLRQDSEGQLHLFPQEEFFSAEADAAEFRDKKKDAAHSLQLSFILDARIEKILIPPKGECTKKNS